MNNLDLSVNNLGEKFHTAASEPFFYDTAYAPYKVTGAIPVDEYGRCCIATEIGSRDKKSLRPRKWKCTKECKVPEKDTICSILAIKTWFHEPIQDLRKLLDTIDEGCEHGHYYSQNHVELGGELNEEEQELCQQLRARGHPIPCASGTCSSLIRMLAAVAVHYPRLRRFLHLLYCAQKYNQCILDIDSALCAADFNLLMIAAGISEFAELFHSDIEHENSQGSLMQPGLPGLEAKLQVEHATVITQFEEELNDDPE